MKEELEALERIQQETGALKERKRIFEGLKQLDQTENLPYELFKKLGDIIVSPTHS